jgi:hypothetical protein
VPFDGHAVRESQHFRSRRIVVSSINHHDEINAATDSGDLEVRVPVLAQCGHPVAVTADRRADIVVSSSLAYEYPHLCCDAVARRIASPERAVGCSCHRRARRCVGISMIACAGVYGRRVYEVMRYWDVDQPDWDDVDTITARVAIAVCRKALTFRPIRACERLSE